MKKLLLVGSAVLMFAVSGFAQNAPYRNDGRIRQLRQEARAVCSAHPRSARCKRLKRELRMYRGRGWR